LIEKDIEIQRPEWMPVHFYSLGGINTDFYGAISVSGLFAAGKAKSFCISYMTGWSWCTCIETGFLAGESAGKYAKETGVGKVETSQVKEFKEILYEPLERRGSVTSNSVLHKIQDTIFPYDVLVLKHESRLKKALEKLEQIRDQFASQMMAKDIHELIKIKETESILLNSEMILRASLLRTESRRGGQHFREDFPKRDNMNWLKWIVIKKALNGKMDISTVPLPINKYRFSNFPKD